MTAPPTQRTLIKVYQNGNDGHYTELRTTSLIEAGELTGKNAEGCKIFEYKAVAGLWDRRSWQEAANYSLNFWHLTSCD